MDAQLGEVVAALAMEMREDRHHAQSTQELGTQLEFVGLVGAVGLFLEDGQVAVYLVGFGYVAVLRWKM